MGRKWTGLVAATLLIGLLAGCGNGGTTTSGASGGDSGNGGKIIKIATQSPLSGGSSIQGEAIRLGAQMSLEDHKEEFGKMGYSLELVPYDDQGDPKKGVANAEQIGADQAILGVIGHLNSGVSIPASVVYEKYNIPMISPASTATELTDRNLKVVNRVVARDDFQGPAAANYAVKTVGAKKIFVIQDKTSYGQGLAEAFRDKAKELGATIVGYEGITVGEKDFNGVLNIAATQNPDFIFFGGLYAEGGLIIKQARDKGITAPIMGGDALDSSGLVEVAGADVKGALYSSVAGEIAKMKGGPEWAARYQKEFGKSPEGYSAYAYDSMSVMLNAIKKAIESDNGAMPTREQVCNDVRATKDFKGIATEVTFNDKGDNSFAKVYIYKFTSDTYPGELVSEVSQ
ncbi:branched-chain amino acid ABC transporter substrate-binding protein [Paenibacillus campi]|uniref:branched-chain amino acid ABC transporter substrate-binding protein n=1 Tax=Paenibacillus campi TaxID=3106031 RepID=UPI002AFDD280|nr:branched-chain amino acid ABC transporter substrate-binding protein [Paenibacillus sp. SGZ-1014]